MIIVNLLQKVLKVHPEATIGILTAYTRQRNCYLSAVANMQLAAIPGVDRIKVATFDASQGQQYDFVLMDILVGDQPGFLKDPRRLTVALSRARNGMIIVAPKEKTDKLGKEARFVCDVVNYMNPWKFPLGTEGAKLPDADGNTPKQPRAKMPKCEFFDPRTRSIINHIFVPTGQPLAAVATADTDTGDQDWTNTAASANGEDWEDAAAQENGNASTEDAAAQGDEDAVAPEAPGENTEVFPTGGW